MRKKIFLGGLTFILLGCLLGYGYNIWKNVTCHKKLNQSCNRLQDQIKDTLDPEKMESLFANDAPFLQQTILEEYKNLCGQLENQLKWWQWNLAKKMDINRTETSQEKINKVLQDFSERCPKAMAETYHWLTGENVSLEQLEKDMVINCQTMQDSLLEHFKHRPQNVEVWKYVDLMEQTIR